MTGLQMQSNKDSPFVTKDMFKGLDLVKKVNQVCDKRSSSQRKIETSPIVHRKSKLRIKSAILKPGSIRQPSSDQNEFKPFNFKWKEPETNGISLPTNKNFFIKKKNIGSALVNSQGEKKKIFVLPNGKRFYNFSTKTEDMF